MNNSPLKTKSLVFGPTLILSVLTTTYMILFLFWIVEDVSDSDDELIKLHSEYLGKLFEHSLEKSNLSSIEIAKIFCSENTPLINDEKLIFTLWEKDSLIYSSIPNIDLSDYTFLYKKQNYAFYFYDADFLHRSTYVITYSFKKHSTVAWISLILLIVSVVVSRKWIIRNLYLNRIFQLHSEWSRIGRIASGLIHEIRNPLNAIKVNAQLVEEDIVSSSIEQKNEMVSSIWSIQTEVEHLDQLLAEFVDYAKPKHINFAPTNINIVIEQSLSFFKGEFNQNNIIITNELDSHISKIKSDIKLLKHVFYNLIKNSIQAMPNGGKLHVTSIKQSDKIIIHFNDSGKGITKQSSSSIFDEFYSTKEKGTGLGLAIVKQVLETINGSISFKNNKKDGVTFTVTLYKKQKNINKN